MDLEGALQPQRSQGAGMGGWELIAQLSFTPPLHSQGEQMA